MFHITSPVLYALLVSKFQKIKPCPKSNLMLTLRRYHNIGLSLLSSLMLLGYLLANIQTGKLYSFHSIVCQSYHDNKIIYYSSQMFLYSKYWEWLDTLFLHLSGKPISQLQYTHHMSVPLVTYMNLKNFVTPYALIPAGLNCLVHIFMYWYFAYPKGVLFPIRKIITISQIVQHLVCLIVISYAAFQENCHTPPYAIEISLSAYLMYLVYFSIFYYKSYTRKVNSSH